MTVCRMKESKWNKGVDMISPLASSCDFTLEYSSFASRRFCFAMSLMNQTHHDVPENRTRDKQVQFAPVAVARPIQKHSSVATRNIEGKLNVRFHVSADKVVIVGDRVFAFHSSKIFTCYPDPSSIWRQHDSVLDSRSARCLSYDTICISHANNRKLREGGDKLVFFLSCRELGENADKSV